METEDNNDFGKVAEQCHLFIRFSKDTKNIAKITVNNSNQTDKSLS